MIAADKLQPPLTPKLAPGFRDLMPEQMLARNSIIEKIRRVWEIYGYVPLQTPAVERYHLLHETVGKDMHDSIIKVKIPGDSANFALRIDLTVSLARVIRELPSPLPFRRYQIGTVWRPEEDGTRPHREFTQFDIDTVGTDSEIADVEVIMAMSDTLRALDIGRYVVKFSSRALPKLMLELAGVRDDKTFAMREVLMQRNKRGPDITRLALTTGYTDQISGRHHALHLTDEQVRLIEAFLEIQSEDRNEVIRRLRGFFAPLPGAGEKIDAIERISCHLDSLGYGGDVAAIDVSVFRNLSYYTGPVFEAFFLDANQIDPVFYGGRYDLLIERFLGRRVAATGASIDIDRVLDAMESLHKLDNRRSTARVLVTHLDSAFDSDYLQITSQLRRAGVPTQMFLGAEHTLPQQIKYADHYHVPLAVLYGSREHQEGKISIRDMTLPAAERHQVTVPRADLVSTVQRMLAEIDRRRAG